MSALICHTEKYESEINIEYYLHNNGRNYHAARASFQSSVELNFFITFSTFNHSL